MIVIYQYTYVRAKAGGMLRESNHQELIDQYSKEGWRFVTAIPVDFGGYGQIKAFDLVFEKQK
ncbi:DUF4177 domain-containing protein [Bacillaceae bacterium W0354]